VCGATLISPPNPAGKKVPMWATTGRVQQRGKTPNKEPKARTKKWL